MPHLINSLHLFKHTLPATHGRSSIRRCSDIYAPCPSPITIEIWGSILGYFFINHTLTRARWPDVPPFRSHRQPAVLLSEAYSCIHCIASHFNKSIFESPQTRGASVRGSESETQPSRLSVLPARTVYGAFSPKTTGCDGADEAAGRRAGHEVQGSAPAEQLRRGLCAKGARSAPLCSASGALLPARLGARRQTDTGAGRSRRASARRTRSARRWG